MNCLRLDSLMCSLLSQNSGVIEAILIGIKWLLRVCGFEFEPNFFPCEAFEIKFALFYLWSRGLLLGFNVAMLHSGTMVHVCAYVKVLL